jgi:uncharacterized membrane protein
VRHSPPLSVHALLTSMSAVAVIPVPWAWLELAMARTLVLDLVLRVLLVSSPTTCFTFESYEGKA